MSVEELNPEDRKKYENIKKIVEEQGGRILDLGDDQFFVTFDMNMTVEEARETVESGRAGEFTETDAEVPEGNQKMTASEWHERNEAIKEEALVYIRPLMSRSLAVKIRDLRANGYSHREIAQYLYDKHEFVGIDPPNNQMYGIAAQQAAADALGEDYSTAPWT